MHVYLRSIWSATRLIHTATTPDARTCSMPTRTSALEDIVKSISPMRELSGPVLSFFLFALAAFIILTLPPAHLPWMINSFAHRLPVVPSLCFLAITIGAGLVVPRLRSALRCCAIARQEHAKLLAAAESSMDDFYIFDGVPDASGTIVDFRFSYINPKAELRLNARREALIGRILTDVRPNMISSGLIEDYRKVVRTGLPFTAEVFIDDERIKATWVSLQVVKLGTGIAITSRDVTERKRLVDHISYLAHYDQLTGVANRTLLEENLQKAILHAEHHKQKIAVFMLDVDSFKHINDTLGHANGDALLSAIAKRLLSCVEDTATVARIGGDEFVILMPNFATLEDVTRRGQHIVKAAAMPTFIGNMEINITISMGLCIYPDGGLDAKVLLEKADAAMYVVKRNGHNGLHLFTGTPPNSAEENVLLKHEAHA